MVLILPRAVWTSRTNAWSYSLKPADVHTMAIHWPGTPVKTYRLDEKSIGKVIAGFEAYHVGTRGWPGIGYCWLIDWQGRVWEGAGDRKAAHSATTSYPTANAEIIGVQLILGTEDEVTPAMRQAVQDLYAEKRAKYPRLSKIVGHRDVRGASTTCPGPRAHAIVKAGGFYPAPAPRYSATYVREVQALLNLTGADLVIDGIPGPLTIDAVEDFQRAAGLVVDGDPGPITLAALRNAAIPPAPTPEPTPVPPAPEEDAMPTPQDLWLHPLEVPAERRRDGDPTHMPAEAMLAHGVLNARDAYEAGLRAEAKADAALAAVQALTIDPAATAAVIGKAVDQALTGLRITREA